MTKMSNWKKVKLGEVCKINTDSYSKNDNLHFINYLDTGNITMNRIESYKRLVVGIDEIPSRARRKVKANDIVFSTVRPNQKHYGIIKQPVENMLVSTGFTTISVDTSVSNPLFIYYILTQDYVTEGLQIIAEQSTSTYPALKPSDITNLEFDLPPLDEQKRIAGILGSLDDKIELNNQINANLEEQAQALFKRWFVDFEFPDQNGNPYKSAGGEFIDSELGQIPIGWCVKKLYEISNLIAGGDKPQICSEQLNDICNVPIYSNGISNEGLYGYTSTPRVNDESITVSARGTIGYVCLRLHPYVPIVRLISVVPITGILSAKYLYLWLKNLNISGTGTTQQQLTVPDFRKTDILVPHFDITQRYTTVINSLYSKIELVKDENKNLSDLRNSLLPKLMNNQIKL